MEHKVGRSATAVRNLRLDAAGAKNEKKTGVKTKLSAQDKRAAVRSPNASVSSARRIRDELNLGVHVRTVQRELQNCVFLDYRKADTQHDMKQHHKTARFEWAGQRASLGIN